MTTGLSSDRAQQLAAAFDANDAGRVREILHENPELKGGLSEPHPGAAFGATPLMTAVNRGDRAMAEVLLDAGADIDARSHWWAGGFGVLDVQTELTAWLIERGATVDVHAAARLGMLERLRELVGADPALVHARGGDGQTPLHFASTVPVARYLLEQGADIDALDVDHESTPAQHMVHDRQHVARYLATCGCRTDPLMAAALGDIHMLLTHLDDDPAQIRMSVSDRWFPRHDSRAGGTIYIWTLGKHRTPHQVARDFGHRDIVRLLMDRSPDAVKVGEACEMGDMPAFTALLDARPNVAHTLTDDDRLRLVCAAENDNARAVRMMLAAGWPADARDSGGTTALHWAAWHGNVEMIRHLLRYHPPVEVRDTHFDGPPIGWAIYASKHGWHPESGDYAGAVNALLKAGARLPAPVEQLDASEAVLEALRPHALAD
jgi:ankyrin repeat protein